MHKLLSNVESNRDSNRDKNQLFKDFEGYLKENYGINFNDIKSVVESKSKLEEAIPVSIFVKELGCLEVIVRYMKDYLGYNYKKIGKILLRNEGPIGVTYRNSLKKFEGKLDVSSEIKIPFSIFSNPKFSIFEAIVWYLKDELSFNYHKIAVLLNRDDRTIWTVYQRAKNKRAIK